MVAQKKNSDSLSFSQKYLEDAVYGASDGIVTTFAVVAGVSGASLSPAIVLILGFANLVADGFSMAVGNYLSRRSEQEFEEKKRQEVLNQLDSDPSSAKARLEVLCKKKGLGGKILSEAVRKISSDKDVFADTIMLEEYNFTASYKKPVSSGFATFLAFVVAGFMPLLAYVLAQFIPSLSDIMFPLAIIATAATLVAVGMLKSGVTGAYWAKESGQMLFIGGAAAAVAYFIGYFISTIV